MQKNMRIAAFQPDIALNLGAMIRLAACFGVPIDIIEPCGFPFSVKALRRSAMDYADIAKIERHVSWDSFQQTRKGRLILLSTKAAVPVWDFQFKAGDILMTGRESAGVPDAVHDAADAAVIISMPGGGRSLNVAMSAGIVLAEATRQLR